MVGNVHFRGQKFKNLGPGGETADTCFYHMYKVQLHFLPDYFPAAQHRIIAAEMLLYCSAPNTHTLIFSEQIIGLETLFAVHSSNIVNCKQLNFQTTYGKIIIHLAARHCISQ